MMTLQTMSKNETFDADITSEIIVERLLNGATIVEEEKVFLELDTEEDRCQALGVFLDAGHSQEELHVSYRNELG